MIKNFLSLAVVVLVSVAAPMAQQSAGSITGTVTDPWGAMIPGANLDLKGGSNGIIRNAITDAKGSFTFPDLTPNKYLITVNWRGAARSLSREVDLKVSEQKPLNITFSFAPCSDEPKTAKGEPITEEDHAAIVRELVSSIIGTVERPDDKRPIFVPRNFKASWLTKEQLTRIRIMSREEIQGLTDRTEEQEYWSISELKRNGSCIAVELISNLTVKSQDEDANMAGVVKTYEFRKVSGKWIGLLVGAAIS